MKPQILQRIKALGGDISNVKGVSLAEDILSITFNTVLYERPTDAPWSKATDIEPIFGIDDFIDEHEDLLNNDRQALYGKIIEKYYCLTEEGYGQVFWVGLMFTPFKKDTFDFDEWHTTFIDPDEVALQEIIEYTNDSSPDFIQLFYSYGYPDHLYIVSSDPNPNNPKIFGTDHELYFKEVTDEGALEEFLNKFMTKEELLRIVKDKIEENEQ